MNCKELMVGDLVYIVRGYDKHLTIEKIKGVIEDEDKPYPVTIFTGETVSLNDIKPIPLTEDILVKNGFSEIHHPGTGATDEYSEWFFGGIKIIEWLEDWKYHYFSAGGDGAPIDFQYVHQLQHLLRLVGIEKVIKL